MSVVITAIFEDGVLKPEKDPGLPAGTRVQLFVTPCSDDPQVALDDLDRLCDEDPIQSGGARLTRDQLHERP